MSNSSFRTTIDPRTGFEIIGEGSTGGKVRGLGLAHSLLASEAELRDRYPQVEIDIPRTLVIACSGFDTYVRENGLDGLAQTELPDEAIEARFLGGGLPAEMEAALLDYLQRTHTPLAVRSSSMLEDLDYHAYAGLYRTYMLSNDQADIAQRLDRLAEAVKLVFASTYYVDPRAYARRVGHKIDSCAMAVIIQQVVGRRHGRFYYPAISGVAQSRNYYPLGGMKADEGLATIALGLGKQVVSGERALRFCPKYPKRLLQRSSAQEVLDFAQRGFYAVEMDTSVTWRRDRRDHTVQRMVGDALEEPPVQMLAGTYVPAEQRIRDTILAEGWRVLTFANVLKYDLFPLAGILQDILALGEKALGTVEIEFAVDLAPDKSHKHQFYLLQMRSMTARQDGLEVVITSEERKRALCYSPNTMGNVRHQEVGDVVYIKPDAFDPARTREMVRCVAEINADLGRRRRQYLLVGPGRWGSRDPWLGIPVQWNDIAGVGAIVETAGEKLNADPSQGSHFFHNLTAMGISYLCVTRRPEDKFDWPWLTGQPRMQHNEMVHHVRLRHPLQIKVDGRRSLGVIRSYQAGDNG